jgi:tripartite-type tricarboxylate transporter receptor subunit TctC
MAPSPSRRRFLAGGAALLGTAGLRRSALAGSYAQLSDRTVTLLVGAGVGGGYDLCARLLARHMEQQVPGLRIEIKNVSQASGKLAAKMLQESPGDGSVLLTAGPGPLTAQLLQEEGVAFDLRQWGWLGKVAAETSVIVKGPGADFANLAGLRAKKTPPSMSATSTSSGAYHQAIWCNAMLGLHIKPVPGYKSVERDAAVLQGECMITSESWPTDAQMFEAAGVDIVFRLSPGELPEKYRDRPLLADVVAAEQPSYLPIVRFIEVSEQIQRWFATGPNTDPAVLAEWRQLFDAVTASEAFRSEIGKLNFLVSPAGGAEVAEQIGAALADNETQSKMFQAALECGKAMADSMEASCAHS